METILVREFTTTVTDPLVAGRILDSIRQALVASSVVTVDFDKVQIMTTGCAAQIFGTLYQEIGPEAFSTRVIISNADEDLRIVMKHGILNS